MDSISQQIVSLFIDSLFVTSLYLVCLFFFLKGEKKILIAWKLYLYNKISLSYVVTSYNVFSSFGWASSYKYLNLISCLFPTPLCNIRGLDFIKVRQQCCYYSDVSRYVTYCHWCANQRFIGCWNNTCYCSVARKFEYQKKYDVNVCEQETSLFPAGISKLIL